MIGFWLLIPTVAGFVTSSLPLQQGFSILTPHHPSKLQLNSMRSDSSDSFDNSKGWDIESARRQLEDLMGGTDYGRGDDTSAVAEMLPFRFTEQPNNQLTAVGRLRRTAEIQLLSQLEDAVEAADALNDLWLNERGARSAKDLKTADDIFQKGESSWNKAEDSFLDLIHEHGPHWVEPLHRLAMLYYLQGRLEEARELEEFVLQNKPWHIGSLSNYVRIAESQHDTKTALKWASRRLPQGDRRRACWAQRAAYNAMNVLTRDERRLQAFLGEPNVMPQDEPFQ
jgi:tetratricopeptide (TPR) repeat protein